MAFTDHAEAELAERSKSDHATDQQAGEPEEEAKENTDELDNHSNEVSFCK